MKWSCVITVFDVEFSCVFDEACDSEEVVILHREMQCSIAMIFCIDISPAVDQISKYFKTIKLNSAM